MKKLTTKPKKLSVVPNDAPLQIAEPTVVNVNAASDGVIAPIEHDFSPNETALLQKVVKQHQEKYAEEVESIRRAYHELNEKKVTIEKAQADFRTKLDAIGNEEVHKIQATVNSILSLSSLNIDVDDIIYAKPYPDLLKVRIMLKSMME